jgi:hypothetical protein
MTKSLLLPKALIASALLGLSVAAAAQGMQAPPPGGTMGTPVDNTSPPGAPSVSASPASVDSATPTPAQMKAASQAFARADKNKDGELSPTETQSISGMSSQFDSLDIDKDGALSRAEFASGYVNQGMTK